VCGVRYDTGIALVPVDVYLKIQRALKRGAIKKDSGIKVDLKGHNIICAMGLANCIPCTAIELFI
jgi:hypothetical protein